MQAKYTAPAEEITWLVLWLEFETLEFRLVKAKTAHKAHELSKAPGLFSDTLIKPWEGIKDITDIVLERATGKHRDSLKTVRVLDSSNIPDFIARLVGVKANGS